MSAHAFTPRLMQAPAAAYYIGVSVTKFRELVRAGTLPDGIKQGGNVLWDVRDLDSYADGLPREGGSGTLKVVGDYQL